MLKLRRVSVYGGTIKNEAEDCNGISVLGDALVYINGGTISGGKYGIAANYSGSTVNISGGSVESRDNSALYIQNDVICTITDGTIKSANQSAVHTCDGGIANINGGDLTSTSFPTVWIDNEGIANISGGNISNSGYKSYIWNSGTMTISGGVFSANMDKGYIRNYGNFGLQGSPTLINTYIWLSSDDNITISGALKNNDKYTVYVNSSLPRMFTSGWDSHMTDKNASKYFNSPYDNSKIVYRGNEAVIVYYYKITYDANGGSCIIASAEANASGKLASLATPTRDGYSFVGWFTEADGGEQVTTDTVFTDDTTIYAHWTCDHSWGDTYEKDDTQHWQVCTKCSAESEKSNHTWDDGEETTPPTETTEGVMTYKCTVCGAEKTEPIAKLEHTHNFVPHAAVPATCTADGNEAYWTCSGCDKMFLDENGETEIDDIPVIPAGHKYSEKWKYDDSDHWHECTVCHDKKDIAEHTFFEGRCTVCQKADPNYVPPTDTTVTETEPPVTDPSDTEPTVTEPPIVTSPPYIPYFPPNNTSASAISFSKEPFLQNENGKIGWEIISGNILEASDGETVLVNMNGTTELPKNIVSDIAGRDIDLSLIMKGGFVWTINGMSVIKAKNVDMGVRKISGIPKSKVQEFFGDSKTVQIDLRHNGDFGFTAALTLDIRNKYNGMYANSYCYKSRKFEFGDSGEIVDGQASLRFTHASSWLITIETSPVLEDVSSAAAAHSLGTPIDMSNFTGRGITVPEFDFKKKLKLSNQKRRYRILKKRRLDDLVFVL